MRHLARYALCMILMTVLSGCGALSRLACGPGCDTQPHRSSSLVAFLYPNGERPPQNDARPVLHVPLRVGLAFLPSASGIDSGVSEAQKEALLERIRAAFASKPFISEIVIVPDYYFRNARGFDGLESIERLYNLDLVALVSYDQMSHIDDKQSSLAYWTIVGAYFVRGSQHDTTTLVDLAVVDPTSRSLVIRAGGVDSRSDSATLVDLSRKSRESGVESFSAATDAMIGNFGTALSRFEADVKAGHGSVQVESASRGGGGALGAAGVGALMALAALRRRRTARV